MTLEQQIDIAKLCMKLNLFLLESNRKEAPEIAPLAERVLNENIEHYQRLISIQRQADPADSPAEPSPSADDTQSPTVQTPAASEPS